MRILTRYDPVLKPHEHKKLRIPARSRTKISQTAVFKSFAIAKTDHRDQPKKTVKMMFITFSYLLKLVSNFSQFFFTKQTLCNTTTVSKSFAIAKTDHGDHPKKDSEN